MKFEYADKEQCPAFRYGANNQVGTYPLGVQFNWHGGMHVNENGNTAIKAIASGIIIAYRLNKEPIETNSIKFSSGFVLIQHKYQSPKGRELTFYSLYNHLMPYEELKKFSRIPDIFKTNQYTVQGKLQYKSSGVPAYPSISKTFARIIPVNTIVTLDNILGVFDNKPTHWSKKGGYTKVKFTHPDSGKIFNDLYVDLNDKHFEKLNDNMYRVIGYVVNGKCWDYEKLRSSPSYKNDDNVVMQIPNNSKVIVEKKQGNYYKIKSINGKEQEGYVYAESCKNGKSILDFDENNFDEIITSNNCNIPVKAGDIIGFTGPMGHIGQKEHRTTHLEVFTATDPTDFLTGKDGSEKNDITDTKDFIKIEKGALLSHYYPYILKSGDEILVLKVEKEYIRIKLNKQFRNVEKADLGNGTAPSSETANWTYTAFNVDKINEAFEGTLTKDSVITLSEDASQITKDQTSRDVSYTLPNSEHCYWIHKDNMPPDASMMGQNVTLNSDISALFRHKPNKNYISSVFPNDSEEQTELLGDQIVSKKEVEEIKQDDQIWYKIKIQDYRGERIGFIKSNNSKVLKVSAHDWTTFGFKVLKDQPDNFIFDATEKNAPQFLKSVFKEVDTNGNKQISPWELRKGLNDMYVCERLSKLVCYHQSEWGVKYSSLKQEIETLLDKGIEQEEDKDIKKEFEKQKEQSLQVIKDKVNVLDFWAKVKVSGKEIPADMTYDTFTNKYRKMHLFETVQVLHPDDENQGMEQFPTDTKVYHFHPNAFVEQMKRTQPNCFCNKDITVEAFVKIFGDGPWFTAKIGSVDMKRDYPDVYNITTEKLVEALNNTMKEYEINTCLQKAHFLAQIGAETGFQSTEEFADGKDYDISSHRAFYNNYKSYISFLNKYTEGVDISTKTKVSDKSDKIKESIKVYKKAYDDYEKATAEQRLSDSIKELKDKHDKYSIFNVEKEKFDNVYSNSYKRYKLKTNTSQTDKKQIVYKNWRSGYFRYQTCLRYGNAQDGDGAKYKGHGMLQLTWKNNYVKFKKRLKIDCINNPELLSSDIKNACNMGEVGGLILLLVQVILIKGWKKMIYCMLPTELMEDLMD